MKLTNTLFLLSIAIFTVGCSTLGGLSDELSLVPEDFTRHVKTKKVKNKIIGMGAVEIQNYFGKPAYTGTGYYSNKKKRDFVLIYPIIDNGKLGNTVMRATYNLKDRKYCAYIVLMSENNYLVPKNGFSDGFKSLIGNQCSPWGGDSLVEKFKEVSSKKFQKLLKK